MKTAPSSSFVRGLLTAGCLLMAAPLMAAARKPDTAPAPAPDHGYLFVHFTGESPLGEQIYFAVSRDGLRWTDLNNSAPILLSRLGEKGVRDPSIVRSVDGGKFYLLATDLRIANGRGWDAARFQGSKSLVIWESADLVNWSEPWMADVSSDIPGAGCTWAPEAIYDDTTGDYIVYWATISPKGGVTEARIYYSKTKDFKTFTPATLYIERNGQDDGDIIDTQIIPGEGGRYRYYRASRDSQITLEGADAILGQWTRIGDISSLGYTAKQVEGPILYKFNGEHRWGLWVDQYAAGKGYLPLVSQNLDDPAGFKVLHDSQYALGDSHKRHGGILNISRTEYDALLARWPTVKGQRIQAATAQGMFVRHANYDARIDPNVSPAQDALWRIVKGLAGAGDDLVSIMSVNFPGYYLKHDAGDFSLAANDGGAAFAAQATFRRVPGLADRNGVSFQDARSPGRYIICVDGLLKLAPVNSAADKTAATFHLID